MEYFLFKLFNFPTCFSLFSHLEGDAATGLEGKRSRLPPFSSLRLLPMLLLFTAPRTIEDGGGWSDCAGAAVAVVPRWAVGGELRLLWGGQQVEEGGGGTPTTPLSSSEPEKSSPSEQNRTGSNLAQNLRCRRRKNKVPKT